MLSESPARINDTTSPTPDSRHWTSMEITLMVGAVALIMMNAFEGLATTTIMPNIVADLGAESWFSVASGSAMAASLFAVVIAGALADWRGVREVLLIGAAAFTLGLILCALAPHVSLFVVGRLIQGLGGGLIIVPLYMLIGSVASEEHRPAYFAAFSLAWTLPAIVGPALAGWAAETVGWRWVFGAVPALSIFALIPLLPLMRALPHSRQAMPDKLKSLVMMAFTAAVGVLILQLAGAFEGVSLFILCALGFVLTGVFLPKMLPVGLFRFSGGLPSLIGARMFAMAGLSATHAFIPLILQRIHSWDATWASLAVTLGSTSWTVGAVFQARVRSDTLRQRFPLVGTSLMAFGLTITTTLIYPGLSPWIGLAGSFFVSAGVGLMHATVSGLSLAMTPQKDHGKVSSWLQVADSAGAALQLAIVSVALAAFSYIPAVSNSFWFYLPPVVLSAVAAFFAVYSARAVKF